MSDYTKAYENWISTLPQIPFHRDFTAPILDRLGIGISEFAWLPLIKCPLPARTPVPEDDILEDRIWLWDQIYPLRPPVILAQGSAPFKVLRGMCEGKFPHKVVLQKIGRVGTNDYHASEDARVIGELQVVLGRGHGAASLGDSS